MNYPQSEEQQTNNDRKIELPKNNISHSDKKDNNKEKENGEK